MTISFEGYTINASVGAATSLALTKPPGVKTFFNTGETEWKDELDPNVIERAVKMVLKR